MAPDWRAWIAAFGVIVLVSTASDPAAAADLPQPGSLPNPVAYTPPVPDWIVTIGAEFRIVPAWPGAPDSKIAPCRVAAVQRAPCRRAAALFRAARQFRLHRHRSRPIQVRTGHQLCRRAQGCRLCGHRRLGNVALTVQAGAFAEYWPFEWLRLRTEVRQGFGGEGGVTNDTFLDAVVPLGQFRWSAGPRVTFASAPAINPYYGITLAQSIDSVGAGLPQLPVYHASGGLYSYGAGTQLQYFINDQWETHGFVEYQRLADSVADSPLVTQRGSANQWTYGLGATYSFSMHPLW